MRALQFFALLVLVAAVLAPFLRRRSAVTGRPAMTRDELVKDPVCQTYIVRSRAVHGSSGPPYFCSAECARRWAAGTRG